MMLQIKTVEIPVSGIILFSLFLLILLIYLLIYFRFIIIKKRTTKIQLENAGLKDEVSLLLEELEKKRVLLAQKTTIISHISSEIRTPLNAIYGFSELLSDQAVSEKERTCYTAMILRNASQLSSIVDDITDISNIDKGVITINPENISLNQLIDKLEYYIKRQLTIQKKTDIKVKTIKYLTDELSCFEADQSRIKKIMQKLLDNAIKFTENGFIEFGYKLLEDDFLLFYVSDSGIGIEKEYQKGIFDEFTQINKLDSELRSGSGLGLAVSKKLAELMGGKMWVESVKESGSTFYFSLPGTPCEKKEATESDQQVALQPNCWKDKTILIVDDYQDVYYFLSETLAATGISSLYADTGKKAIDLCKDHPEIQLILMDVQMPEMSGIEATKTIRTFQKQIPIIAQTAYAGAENFDVFIDAGFNDIIEKPIRKDLLLKKLSKYMVK